MTQTASNLKNEGMEYLFSLDEWKGERDFDLRRITGVLKLLGDPQDRVPAIHIAGTNGKGSVSAAISAILGAAGYSVGLNISPHLSHICERIVVNGYPLTPEELGAYALRVKIAASSSGVRLSRHEGITAIAFLAFSELKLDWMVMEVGLGGRLDSSNVMRSPKIGAIVSIDYDHEQILGETLEKIATEKAGIIKSGMPIVVGDLVQEAFGPIEQKAEAQRARIVKWGRDFEVVSLGSQQFRYISDKGELVFSPSLRGSYQPHNMAIAISLAKELGIQDRYCKEGVEGVFWPGRFEEIELLGKRITIDAAHNVDGVRALVQSLTERGDGKVSIGFGALDNKRWREMIEILLPVVSSWNLLTPGSDRALPSAKIGEFLSCLGVKFNDWDRDYRGFVDYIKVDENRSWVVAGSIYLIGIIRDIIAPTPRAIWKRSIEG